MGYKTVIIYGRILCSSVLIFPFLFPLNDSITELISAKLSYFMIAAIIICEFLFSFSTYAMAHLPSPAGWKNQEIYPLLTSGFIHIAIADSISLFIGFFANTYVFKRWGIKLFGNSFFMKSLGATAIGELLFTISTNILTFHIFSEANLSDTFNIIFSDYILKMIYSFLICIPNAYIVMKIKQVANNDKEVSNNGSIILFKKPRISYRN